MSFLAELKRRNVFKVGIAYAVVAWLLAQAATMAFPIFGAPDWALRVVVFCLALGFPVALLLAWALELTPEGVQVAQGTVGNKRFYAGVAVLALLAVGWFLQTRAPEPVPTASVLARSIAVLPFVDMSPAKDQGYFSDGISEEILNSLAKIPELKVAARTSSFKFKGADRDVPEIARELKVLTVLEGSVRKQANRVRITAQLIDANTGYHLWSETYDRELTDIFAIQDEIAAAIAGALRIQLGIKALPQAQSIDARQVEAYELYLKGLQRWQRRTEADLRAAIALFEQAIGVDPGFARAHAGVALVYAVLPDYSSEPLDHANAKVNEAATRALELDPSSAEAYAALGSVARDQHDFQKSATLFERALALRPSFATARQWLGLTHMLAGDLARAEAALRTALELDPASRIIHDNLSWVLLLEGRYGEALVICRESFARDPADPLCPRKVMLGALALGELAEARSATLRVAASNGAPGTRLAEDLLAVAAGGGDAAALAAQLLAFDPDSYFDPASANFFGFPEIVPFVLAQVRQDDAARVALERLAKRQALTFEWVYWAKLIDPIACEPELRALATGRGASAERVQQRCVGVTVAR